VDDVRALCSGPGKLCQALGITREHDGLVLDLPPFELEERTEVPEILTAPRVGITRATDLNWRYLAAKSPYLSRSAPRAS
jgi:DNA-3-methyladenine glycosylase